MRVINITVLLFCVASFHHAHAQVGLFRRFFGSRTTTITCSPAHSRLANGVVSCSNSNNLNSVCTFSCNPNFALVGSTQSVCNDDGNGDQYGVWSRRAPVCIPRTRAITCSPAHSRLANGVVSCSNSNNLNSVCRFSCYPGLELVGSTQSVCNDDGNGDQYGVWSRRAPVCIPRTRAITCSPAHSGLANGVVSCSNSNNLNSVCRFSCNPNFALVGSTQSVCNDDGNGDQYGVWSRRAPVCIPRTRAITCSPAHSRLANGVVSCSNSNNLNSVCRFSCYPGLELVGSTQSVCNDDGNGDQFGVWSRRAPVCIPRNRAITCSPAHPRLANGVVSCSNSNNLNSVCRFSCYPGLELVGSTQSVCNDDGNGDQFGVWLNPPRFCRPKPPTPRPVLCEYDGGDRCTSQDGTNFYKIRKAKGCPDSRVKCTKPEVGAVLFQSNLLGPQVFQHGSSSSSGGGAQAPALFPLVQAQPVSFLSYDDGIYANIALPTFVTATTTAKPKTPSCSGIPDGKGGFAFGSCNERIPLTRKKRMVSNKKRDLVLLLDESGSVGKERFQNVTRIAAAIVKLLCGDTRYHKSYTRITVISFDQQVHFHIRLNQYLPSAKDLAEYIRKKINYNSKTAGSTCLGKALAFVYDVALNTGGRRGSPDTEQDIIIITDGCSNCGHENRNADETIAYFVKKFKAAGIHVYVIGIGLTGHQANCKDKLSVLATGGRCYHFFYFDRWDYDVKMFIQELEKPDNDQCVNVFERPNRECVSPIG